MKQLDPIEIRIRVNKAINPALSLHFDSDGRIATEYRVNEVMKIIKTVIDETERKMMWQYHDKITDLKTYLAQLEKDDSNDSVLIESVKEKVDEVFEIAKMPSQNDQKSSRSKE